MNIVSVYVTFANAEEAERIGRTIVEERLAACINIIGAVRSIYRWQGVIESTEECAAILKTTVRQADALIARVAELHSYEVPAISVWPVDKAHAAYADWVATETR